VGAWKVLELFGVGQEIESIYVAFLDHPAASAREIAGLLGITESQVHSAFDELARLSLVRSSWEEPGTIRPVRPDIGLPYLIAREQADLLRRQDQIEHSRAAIAALIADLSSQHQTPPSQISFSQVFGLDHIRIKLEQLAHGTRQEVLSLMPNGPQSPDSMEASRPLDEMLLRRGVQVLTVYLESVRNDPQNRQYVEWLLELGGEVRIAAILPLRMLIFDRTIAVVPINPDRTAVGVAVVEGSGPVAAMSALFDAVWENSAPYRQTRTGRRAEERLTDQQLAVVRFLAFGDTDAVIGRKLGISQRTTGRLVSEVMTKLGARSRFQAGVRVGELGWHNLPLHPAREDAAS
jgi:sugar-specific transcriptional regulator TrmB/DNA-binding CsgD family transcriptional regulator